MTQDQPIPVTGRGAGQPLLSTKDKKYCWHPAYKADGPGICGAVLNADGSCPNADKHINQG
jgi:hypothetical protein